MPIPDALSTIEALQLTPHGEGGYFRRTYQSALNVELSPDRNERALLSSIYYLLSNDAPIGHLHVNRSDIIHFYHSGAPIRYTLVSPTGAFSQVILGNDLSKGQQPQLLAPGNWWKTSELLEGEADYGLISEAVSPAFEYEDMRFISKADVREAYPNLRSRLETFCRE